MAQQVIFDAEAIAQQLEQYKGRDVKTDKRITNLPNGIRQTPIHKLVLNDDGTSVAN